MADVTKIDIDGVQWDIKDQNARDRITVLEEKTTVKVTKKIDANNIKMNLVEINKEKFIQLYIYSLNWDVEASNTIANFVNDFELKQTIRGTVVAYDSVLNERITCGIDLRSDGAIILQPCIALENQKKYKNSKIYGDVFARVNI